MLVEWIWIFHPPQYYTMLVRPTYGNVESSNRSERNDKFANIQQESLSANVRPSWILHHRKIAIFFQHTFWQKRHEAFKTSTNRSIARENNDEKYDYTIVSVTRRVLRRRLKLINKCPGTRQLSARGPSVLCEYVMWKFCRWWISAGSFFFIFLFLLGRWSSRLSWSDIILYASLNVSATGPTTRNPQHWAQASHKTQHTNQTPLANFSLHSTAPHGSPNRTHDRNSLCRQVSNL